jgi:hypothetical protein
VNPRGRGPVALFLACLIFAGPLVPAARATPLPGPVTLEGSGLKRTNQVLAVLIAFLKLVDEIGGLPGGGGMPPMPPPIGTGHPGPGPGPLPIQTPDDPPAEIVIPGPGS